MRSLIALALGCLAAAANAQFLGPTPYLKFADSPFFGGSFTYFHLERFENGSLQVPGVSANFGAIYGPASNADSVDEDDGVIDGFGTNAHSWFFNNGATGVTWTFDAGTLGLLPTHAGIVWTDGSGTITFEAWDQNGVSLGTVTGNHADGSFGGTTAEDRFYGIIHSSGISKIKIRNTGGGIEMDHLQYGFAVPEPSTLVALGLSGLLFLRRRRR